MAYTYILKCSNDQYYVGSTMDLGKRIKQHQNVQGCDFTRNHRPVELMYYEEYDSIDDAYIRERQLHGWSRRKKEALITGKLKQMHK